MLDKSRSKQGELVYGRVVYNYPNGSLREPPVPRDSETFRRAYKRRTTIERSLKRSLVDRHLAAYRTHPGTGALFWLPWPSTLTPGSLTGNKAE